MRKAFIYFLMPLLFLCCQNKINPLFTKKWDCVQVENMPKTENSFIDPQADSINKTQLESILKTLSWTFKKNQTYQINVGEKITTRGAFELTANEKMLTLKPITNNSINMYKIDTLTKNDLILTSINQNAPIKMYFKPNN